MDREGWGCASPLPSQPANHLGPCIIHIQCYVAPEVLREVRRIVEDSEVGDVRGSVAVSSSFFSVSEFLNASCPCLFCKCRLPKRTTTSGPCRTRTAARSGVFRGREWIFILPQPPGCAFC